MNVQQSDSNYNYNIDVNNEHNGDDINPRIGYENADDDDNVNDNNNNNNVAMNMNTNNNNREDKNKNKDNHNYIHFGRYGETSKTKYNHRYMQHIDDNSVADLDDTGGKTSGDALPSRIGHNKHKMHQHYRDVRAPDESEKEEEVPSSLSVNSDENQPDIIPYPPAIMTIGSARQRDSHSNSNNNNDSKTLLPATNDIIERQEQRAQQEKYFYEEWLQQQRQQKSQESLLEQILGT